MSNHSCHFVRSVRLAPRIAPNLITLNSAIAACDKAGQGEVALSLPLDYFGSRLGIWGSLIKLAVSGSDFIGFWFIYSGFLLYRWLGCYCSQLAVHQPEACFDPVWPPLRVSYFQDIDDKSRSASINRAGFNLMKHIETSLKIETFSYFLVCSPYFTSSTRQR